MLVTQLCPTLGDLMDCSLPGSSVHAILQARILEWVAIPFSRGSSWPRDRTWVSCITGESFTIWATHTHKNLTSFLCFLGSHLWGGRRACICHCMVGSFKIAVLLCCVHPLLSKCMLCRCPTHMIGLSTTSPMPQENDHSSFRSEPFSILTKGAVRGLPLTWFP